MALSTDQTAEREDERQRMIAAGGHVQFRMDSWRVGKAGIQVSRCASSGSSPFACCRPDLRLLQSLLLCPCQLHAAAAGILVCRQACSKVVLCPSRCMLFCGF